MDQPLFRQESLERIASPESLHDYPRVTSPKLWMVLAAVLALAAGFILYASAATMEEVLPVQVDVETYQLEEDVISLVTVTLPITQKGLVKPGMTVRFAGLQGTVETLFETDSGIGLIVDAGEEKLDIQDGQYDGEIVTETTSPVSFLLK